MNLNRSSWGFKLGINSCLALTVTLIYTQDYGLAQVVKDNTLGTESSIVTPTIDNNGFPSNKIDGGAIREANLFHSFQEFNVGEGQGVYFTNPVGVENIISRVTGGSRSNILGSLGVLGSANLFLINPNGIIFGPKASLDIRGSFIATTASSLNFADNTQFSANASQTTPLLTMSVPVGLQFGAIAESIHNQSRATDIRGVPVGLKVDSDRTLALVGGEVLLEGGYLTAEGGWVELGSVGSFSFVTLTPNKQNFFLEYGGTKNFQDITLSDQAVINPNGMGSNIDLHGRNVIVTDESNINTLAFGAEPAGNITVTASDSVQIIGIPQKSSTLGLFSSTIADGDAGNITINTRRLIVNGRAAISTASSGIDFVQQQKFTPAKGRGGNLTINASESVHLVNLGSLSTETRGIGDAGNVIINTRQLTIQDGAAVNLSSSGEGNAGNLEITASSLRLDNGGKITATSKLGRGGGNITLQALDLVQMQRNSEISTNAEGTGVGGNIRIKTDILVGRENSDITATAVEGRGGNIAINTQGIFGIEPRSKRNPETSDITASSELGVDGLVEINRPDINLNSGLVSLPAELVDVTGLIAQGCGAGGRNVTTSKFIATGRGGLPPNAMEALRSDPPLADLATLNDKSQEERASAATSMSPIDSAVTPVVEAQGWAISSKGKVVLTAQTSANSSIPWLTPNTCNAS